MKRLTAAQIARLPQFPVLSFVRDDDAGPLALTYDGQPFYVSALACGHNRYGRVLEPVGSLLACAMHRT